MKLKQLPTDFCVEELASLEVISQKDEHTIFLLVKQDVDTFDALRRIAGKLRISLFEIGYAGLKDKHALAKQFISIPTRYNVQSLKMDGLVLSFVGYTRKKIKIGDLVGNKFTIVVRDLKDAELKEILARAETIPLCGVPNYFDSQRFGSVIDQGFIGKQVIQKQYEAAVKQYLTAYQKSESKKIKDEKRKILLNWDDLSKVRVFNKPFSMVIKEYLRTKSWREAYKKIPAHLREMFVNAYQSYLWNECVKGLLKTSVEKKKLYSVEYSIGYLLFYTNLSEQELKNMPPTFLTVSETAMFTDTEQRIVTSLLVKEGLSLTDFNVETETGNFFKTRAREILLIPKDFMITKPETDELNSKEDMQRLKIQLSFSLPKGSYATVVTKRIFNH